MTDQPKGVPVIAQALRSNEPQGFCVLGGTAPPIRVQACFARNLRREERHDGQAGPLTRVCTDKSASRTAFRKSPVDLSGGSR